MTARTDHAALILGLAGVGRARRVALMAASLAATALASGCSGSTAGPDAATVEVTFTDAAIFTDSSSACVVTLRPADGPSEESRARPGVVLGCPGLDAEPTVGQVQVDPGTYVVEAGQWRCPGMPGERSQDPDDVM